jgi:hypothetical protein
MKLFEKLSKGRGKIHLINDKNEINHLGLPKILTIVIGAFENINL